jgi:hypothetical protein
MMNRDSIETGAREAVSPWWVFSGLAFLILVSASLSLRLVSNAPKEVGDPADNERNAPIFLKQLLAAQVAFKAGDLDRNNQNDYWVGNIIFLSRFKLIEGGLAEADASLEVKASLIPLRPIPLSGYYFSIVPKYGPPESPEPYDRGAGYNADRWAACAFPARYGETGKLTFIVDESGQFRKKDTGGRPVDRFPSDPQGEGWGKLD